MRYIAAQFLLSVYKREFRIPETWVSRNLRWAASNSYALLTNTARQVLLARGKRRSGIPVPEGVIKLYGALNFLPYVKLARNLNSGVMQVILGSTFLDLAARLAGPKALLKLDLWRTARWRNFEPEFYLLEFLVDRRRAAVDVGANEGIYAARFSQLCRRVHCFEPIPWFAARLKRTLGDRVVVHETALSNTAGEAWLRVPYDGETELDGLSTLEAGNPLREATHTRILSCRTEKLDDAVQEPIGFVKIDVEGHELAVLEGAVETIARDMPVFLVESERRHNPRAPEAVFDFFVRHGYSGLFCCNGRWFNTEAFTLPVHQTTDNLGKNKYANNFLFFPRHAGSRDSVCGA